ncbi:MAG: hypothetical protein Q8P81_02550 [Nanoarchaeota archaeon]|nr:hypothetical protein [Nanoarchaeota archaeon]
MEERGLVVFNSCVYLNIILQEGLHNQCNDEVDKIMGDESIQGAITPVIIEEVISRIRKAAEEDDSVINSIRKEVSKELEERNLNSNLELFFSLIKGFELITPKDKKEYHKISQKLANLRLGPGRNNMDRINLAISINNKCNNFITTEKNIHGEKKRIMFESKDSMNIKLIS